MDFPDRFAWLLLGCLIGFVVGYIVRTLQEMKKELDEVDGIVKRHFGRRRDDNGYSRVPFAAEIALIVVVALTVWAAFASQKASNDVRRVTDCNQVYLTKTVKALNERTEFATAQALANVKLQTAQQDFFALLLHSPPYTQAKRSSAAHQYLTSLNEFVLLSNLTATKTAQFPFPTSSDLSKCYHP